eukprot:CAMPEP_0176457040 /NCGR_PEP_ID=MMETSP0127-20121128/31672_1 /TAXON_ID=938130 /ORGANISM="Platyophrya macrostoma, Strain WH" /LENGTH=305 /DNA_ID=CAMNT_0017847165 /DNA_START=33 /DNA_END=950 /DNA_ORIENTATION=+
MTSRLVLGLAGVTAASTLCIVRHAGIGLVVGTSLGTALAYYNDSHHSIENAPVASLDSLHVQGDHVPVSYRPSFTAMKKRIYEHLSERYEELGQLEIGEEHITVQDHVFAQIGVIDDEGIRNMWRMISLDLKHMLMPASGLVSTQHTQARHNQGVVFCDLGSGVGNVCMQILGETSCNHVVGVEIIPSRHNAAVTAYQNAVKYFPEAYDPLKKKASFYLTDIVGCERMLNQDGVNILFTHSWMFDDVLMGKLGELVQRMPQLQMVITSRPIDPSQLKSTPLTHHKLVHFSADWNEAAPFHVYFKG